jgi:hypothetical protein
MAFNPRIKSIDLGTQELISYTIYPLSMADEFRISDIITKIANEVLEMENKGASSDAALGKLALEVIKDNIGTLLKMTTKANNRPELAQIDNVKFSELVELIFEMNFETSIKNFQSLVERIKGMFQPTRQSQQSLDIPATD